MRRDGFAFAGRSWAKTVRTRGQTVLLVFEKDVLTGRTETHNWSAVLGTRVEESACDPCTVSFWTQSKVS